MKKEWLRTRDLLLIGGLILLAVSWLVRAAGPAAPPASETFEINDSHLHLTNYVQEGTSIHDFLNMMGTKVGRAAIFGIPLQQEWSYSSTGGFAPTFYLQTDAPLSTTRSPTLSSRWRTGRCRQTSRRGSTP